MNIGTIDYRIPQSYDSGDSMVDIQQKYTTIGKMQDERKKLQLENQNTIQSQQKNELIKTAFAKSYDKSMNDVNPDVLYPELLKIGAPEVVQAHQVAVQDRDQKKAQLQQTWSQAGLTADQDAMVVQNLAKAHQDAINAEYDQLAGMLHKVSTIQDPNTKNMTYKTKVLPFVEKMKFVRKDLITPEWDDALPSVIDGYNTTVKDQIAQENDQIKLNLEKGKAAETVRSNKANEAIEWARVNKPEKPDKEQLADVEKEAKARTEMLGVLERIPFNKGTGTYTPVTEENLLKTPGFKGLFGGIKSVGNYLPGTAEANLKTKIEQYRSQLTSTKLGLMKGVLSETDMKIIQKMSSPLSYDMSDKEAARTIAESYRIESKFNDLYEQGKTWDGKPIKGWTPRATKTTTGIPSPQTQKEYDDMDPGTVYIDTDGVTKRKK